MPLEFSPEQSESAIAEFQRAKDSYENVVSDT